MLHSSWSRSISRRPDGSGCCCRRGARRCANRWPFDCNLVLLLTLLLGSAATPVSPAAPPVRNGDSGAAATAREEWPAAPGSSAVYVRRVFTWAKHYAPIIDDPADAEVASLPDDWEPPAVTPTVRRSRVYRGGRGSRANDDADRQDDTGERDRGRGEHGGDRDAERQRRG
jgi:hypothetical protein